MPPITPPEPNRRIETLLTLVGVLVVAGVLVVSYQQFGIEKPDSEVKVTTEVAEIVVEEEVAEEVDTTKPAVRENDHILVGSSSSNACRSNQYPDSPYDSVRSGYVGGDSGLIYFYEGDTPREVAGVDQPSFECLDAYKGTKEGRFYAKDKDRVYFNGTPITNADPASFETLKFAYYAKDKNAVYAAGELLPEIDPDTFEFLSANVGVGIDGDLPKRHYAIDKERVVINQIVFENSDSATFAHVGEPQYGYAKDKNNVYYGESILAGVDVASYEVVVEGLLFRDKDHVYYKRDVLEGADPTTFTILSKKTSSGLNDATRETIAYALDTTGAYRNDKKIGDSSSDTIKIFADRYLLINDTLHYVHNFYNSVDLEVLISAPESLEYLGHGYFRDIDQVYYLRGDQSEVYVSANPETFAIYYSDDTTEEYYRREGDTILVSYYPFMAAAVEEVVEEADAETFSLIAWPYAKDDERVFYINRVATSADPTTFSVISTSSYAYGRDAADVYYQATKLDNADPASFRLTYELLEDRGYSNLFGVDTSSVYYRDTRLVGIDPGNMTIERSGAIVRSGDVAWYLIGNCMSVWYVPEDEVDLTTYHPPC